MLIGLLSDAHGNPLGLRSCLAALRDAGVGRVYFLGDAVGYLPGEAEVIDILLTEGVVCQRGNHEAMLLGDLDLDHRRDRAYGLASVVRRMPPGVRAVLAGWPSAREVELAGRRLLLVHGSPRDHLSEYVYPDSDIDWIGSLGYDAVFMGNTHRPFAAHRGAALVVNVGSCGLPRDQGNLAACAVYDPAANECQVLRVPMDPAAVAAQFAEPVSDLVAECLSRQAAQPFGSIVRPGWPQRWAADHAGPWHQGEAG
ncbi:MAG TPA: metallophosphoesterase family protein [Streptosporangiaceae bacterium]|nr:metallophosphoesterase family protein [Streptosporangiaceae bacterium]